MFLQEFLKKKKDVSAYIDPFKSEYIESVSTFMFKSFDGIHITGRIKFNSGDTRGEQKFESDSLEGLLNSMDIFVKSLNNGRK